MKKLLLLLAIFASSVFALQAQDWANINFTRDSTSWGQGTTPTQPNNQSYSNRTFGDYLINGFFGRFNAANQKINSENPLENFIMSWRLSAAATNQLVFPKYDNIGRLKIHYYNVNTSIGGRVRLQYNSAATGETPVWSDFDPVIEPTFLADNGSSSSSIIDIILNLGSTQLRIAPAIYDAGTGNKWLQVYAISISKGPVSGVEKNVIDNIKLSLSGRVLAMTSTDNVCKASIFNLAGVRIGNFTSKEKYTFNTSGSYIVRIETAEKTITRKIVVL